MVTASFRFYGALNDFLPRERRQCAFECACARRATTKHMIEALGAPHTEVALVLVNGETAGLDRILYEGDRVAAYPKFESLDIGELKKTSGPPSGVRFVADVHLGGLARLLRMAGFDTLYDHQLDDPQIAAIGALQERIVLTRDRDLLKRREVTHGCYVRALKAPEQLKEIVDRLELAALARPFTLCLQCNAPLHAIDKELVQDRLPPSVRLAHTEFRTCDVCHGVFWQGSHWKRMRGVLADIRIPYDEDEL
jgi:uncharacterized protein